MDIEFTSSLTERTTAVTDLILAIEFLIFAIQFYRASKKKIHVASWAIPFLLLSAAFLTGAIFHGIVKQNQELNVQLKFMMAFLTAFGLAHLVSASVREWQIKIYLKSVIVMSLVSIGFIVVSAKASSFNIYVIFIIVSMFLVTRLNMMQFRKSKRAGHLWIILGAILTAIAGLIQLKRDIRFTIIWEFDCNGAFHLVQIIATFILGKGILYLLKK
ncbi:MAG: hypothetical protein MJH11_07400 [Lentisphaeria bacterium]|nr:hypothetical protein [Lentisphaeria bacterium]